MKNRPIYLIALALMFCTFGFGTAFASEGGASNYSPGTYGDFAVAVPPNPGWTYLNYTIFIDADLERAVLQGRVNLDLETNALINMSAAIYTFEQPVLGGRFAMGGFVPFGYADFKGEVEGRYLTLPVDESKTAFGDIALLPASFYWNKGNWYFNLYELVVTPSGQYNVNNAVNLGRNYWSFDTVFAVTNLNMDTGREFSFAAGYMINTENGDTHYETGDELHIDAMFNQFLSETFALGLHGYYYDQVQGDSGSGAILGGFKGRSYGIGPSFLWMPKAGGGKFSVSGTWLHDLDATRRLKTDYVVVMLGWQFGTGN